MGELSYVLNSSQDWKLLNRVFLDSWQDIEIGKRKLEKWVTVEHMSRLKVVDKLFFYPA